MGIGDLIRFTNEPQWGVGIITSERNIGGFFVYFPQIDDWFAVCEAGLGFYEADREHLLSVRRCAHGIGVSVE